jgi:RND family efflux transporter MFP subunit
VKRLLLYFGLAVLVIAAFVFVWLLHHQGTIANEHERARREHQLSQGPRVVVAHAEPAPASRTIVLPGDVHALRVATVYARVSGYLVDLRVDRGDRVLTNQILGAVTAPENERQLGPLIDNLITKRAIADRLVPLVPKGVVAQQDLDRANADVQAAKSDVDRLRALLGEQVIRAPFAGTVTKRYVDVGALMPAPTGTTQTAQPLVDVADLSRVRIVVYVGQRDAVGIQPGDPVEVTRDDDPTHPIHASVTRIPSQLDLNTRTMWVETDVDNPTGRLYPGLFVTVTLHVAAPRGVLIPADAIALTAGNASVAVIKNGRVHVTAVEVADDDGKVARIVRGLSTGDQVAARLSDALTDNAKVRVVEPTQKAGPAQARGRGP